MSLAQVLNGAAATSEDATFPGTLKAYSVQSYGGGAVVAAANYGESLDITDSLSAGLTEAKLSQSWDDWSAQLAYPTGAIVLYGGQTWIKQAGVSVPGQTPSAPAWFVQQPAVANVSLAAPASGDDILSLRHAINADGTSFVSLNTSANGYGLQSQWNGQSIGGTGQHSLTVKENITVLGLPPIDPATPGTGIDSVLQLVATSSEAGNLTTTYSLFNGANSGGGAAPTGCLSLYQYAGPAVNKLFSTTPGVAAGASLANPAHINFSGAQQTGKATAVALQTTTVVNLASIVAAENPFVIVQPANASAAALVVAGGLAVTYPADGQFSIAHAAAVGGEEFQWFVARSGA